MKFSVQVSTRFLLGFALSAPFSSITATSTDVSPPAHHASADQASPFPIPHLMPPNPEPFEVTYPDGTTSPPIYLKSIGELTSHPVLYEETTDGFTVKQEVDKDNKYTYVDFDEATGETIDTGLVAGVDDPYSSHIHKGAAASHDNARRRRRATATTYNNKRGNLRNGNNGQINDAASAQDNTNNEPNHGHRRTVITSGLLKNLVIPFKFSDHTARSLPSQSDLNVLMSNDGPDAALCPTGSVRDVYLENSFNSLDLESTVIDWVTLDFTEAFCANGNSGLSTRIHTCLGNALDKAALAGVDFSDYDLDNNNLIDGITFFHSGYAAEVGGTDQYGTPRSGRIWSHKWALFSPSWSSNDGIRVYEYHINPALWSRTGSNIGRIGVIAHETGHFLGLPDLYDYGAGSGIGSFGLMANSWGFDGSQRYPPLMSAWGKYTLGWVTPTVVSSSGSFTLRQACDYPDMIKISAGYPSGEYLLIENRQPCGFDGSMGQGGLAIFHIDDNANNNLGYAGQSGWPANGNHYKVALLQADGSYNMERGNNRGDSNDLFRGGYRDSIGPDGTSFSSNPNTKAYQSGIIIDTEVTISNISAAGPEMTLKITIGSSTSAPVKAPTKAPVKAPTKAPVKAPTKAPVKAPTKAPVKAPTKAPVKAPTKAPVKAPTKAPVKAPTEAPTEALFPKIYGSDYSYQKGTRLSGTTATHFDHNDYMVYSAVDFGPSGTTKGLLINFSKNNYGGKVEIRLGSGTNGKIIAEMNPAHSGGWGKFMTAHVGLIDDTVTGLQDITFVGKNKNGVMNLAWFELSDFSDRGDVYSRISASAFSNQSGTRFEPRGANGAKTVGWYDAGDYLRYSNINFGPAGTTDGIRLRYAKANNGGKVQIRLGDPITGTLLAEFSPARTHGWDMWMEAYVGLDGISGIQDLTFVAKDKSGVMNMEWFELSNRSELFPKVLSTAFSTQSGVQSDTQMIGWFDTNDSITYSNLNFGSPGTTKSIRLSYSKANSKGKAEIRVGGPGGTKIATFIPQNTGGWDNYVEVDIPIGLVEVGTHDLTFVAKDANGVMNMKYFELSDKMVFNIATDYKVNDNKDSAQDVQCTYDVVKAAYTEQVYNVYYSNSGSSVDAKFFAQLGVSNEGDANDAVSDLCGSAQAAMDEIPLDDITYADQGSQFIELHYGGRGSWNEETETNLSPGTNNEPANVLKQSAYKVKDYKPLSEKAVFKMPDLPQFDASVCESHAAQCCWPRDRQANDNNGNCKTPYDSDCVDKDVADNTDLCYNTLDKAPYANDVEANGFSTYGDEGPIHCHGFAWSTDDQETTTRYKANALFFVSMYDHMYKRGYVENVPGSPMCGCVEHMPVVTRSDCTQTNVQEYYTFSKSGNAPGFTSVVDNIKLQFQACQGANNDNNDLEAFYQQLVNDGKLSTKEQEVFSKYVVGDDNCPSAVDSLLNKSGIQKGFEIDDSKWTFIVGEGFEDQQLIINHRLFQEMIEAQEVPIVRRACPSCRSSHKDIYYRRLTSFPDEFNLLDTLMNNWFDTDNELNKDFSLHSTYIDAYYGSNPWTFCNFNDAGIGFPRDCGPTSRVNFQWNSYSRNGGDANTHAFLIPADPDFESKLVDKITPFP